MATGPPRITGAPGAWGAGASPGSELRCPAQGEGGGRAAQREVAGAARSSPRAMAHGPRARPCATHLAHNHKRRIEERAASVPFHPSALSRFVFSRESLSTVDVGGAVSRGLVSESVRRSVLALALPGDRPSSRTRKSRKRKAERKRKGQSRPASRSRSRSGRFRLAIGWTLGFRGSATFTK